MSDATADLIGAIADAIADKTADKGWDAFAVVLVFGDGYRRTHGYAYPADGTITAISVDWDAIDQPLRVYLGGFLKPGDMLPATMLVQFDRTSGQCDVTFEDDDEDRWHAGPDNFEELREELRPNFG